MHSFIFQVSTKPIIEDELLNMDHMNESFDDFDVYIDYHLSGEERTKALEHLVGRTLPKGMFRLNDDGKSMTYLGGMSEWSRAWAEKIHELAASVDQFNILKYIGPFYQLEKGIKNPLDTGIKLVTDFYNGVGTPEDSGDFMRFFDGLKIGQRVYIGSVMAYHF